VVRGVGKRSIRKLVQKAARSGEKSGRDCHMRPTPKNRRAIANKSTLFFSHLQLPTARIRSRKSRARHLHLPLSCTRNRLENKVILAAIFSYEQDRPLNRPSCEGDPTWPVARV
jgi:hypothetical protein